MAERAPARWRWKDRYWRIIRAVVQGAALVAFLILFLGTVRGGLSPDLANLFLRLDPLAALASLLASKTFLPGMMLALGTIALTLIFGRVWCGWLCPLGTIFDLFHPTRWRNKQPDLPEALRSIKHFLLIVILTAAALGSLWLMFLDPLTIVFRTLAEAGYPALDRVVTGVESAAYGVPALRPAVSSVDRVLRPILLPILPGFTAGGVLIAAFFVGLIALNALAPRFWCRYLCPLGSMLGLLSKTAMIRREMAPAACNDCGACARVCPTGTIRMDRGGESDPAECTMCLECVAACPRSGQSFSGHLRPAAWNSYDPGRRQALAAIGAAIGGVALLRTDQALRRDLPHLIRPPGGRENDLLTKCIRCGECIRVCPTGAIHPAVADAGFEGFWTPILIPRAGACQYSCNSCGQVCPVQAIPTLPLEEKQITVIGSAYINKNRCIAWADHQFCIVCEEMCPLPEKAITLDHLEIPDGAGGSMQLPLPVVDRTKCIGCGSCEYKCPVNGEAAIRVYAPGRSYV